MRAPLHVAGEHWNVHEEHGRLVYQDEDGLLDLPAPKLNGRHQFDNAGAAIAALRAAGLKLPLAAFESGIVKAEWPARLQLLSHGALKALAPPDSELWLDGGHNAEGGRAVAAAIGDFEERVPRPLVLIVGMLATKDCEGYLRNFAGLARRVYRDPDPATRRKAFRPRRSRRRRATPAFRRSATARIEDGARRGRAARARSAAAHPDRRLALSRRRRAGEERHAAGVN